MTRAGAQGSEAAMVSLPVGKAGGYPLLGGLWARKSPQSQGVRKVSTGVTSLYSRPWCTKEQQQV